MAAGPQGVERRRELRGDGRAGRRGVLRLAERHAGQTVLVVTHGGSIRACRATAAGLDYAASRVSAIGSMANCEVAELHVADGRLAGAAG